MAQFGGDRDILQYEHPHRVTFLRYMTQLFDYGISRSVNFLTGRMRWFRYMALIGGDEDISQREFSHGVR